MLTGLPIRPVWGQQLTHTGDRPALVNSAAMLKHWIVPQLFDVVLKQGDLKYKDMNEDGVVDDNDQSALGHTSPRLYYALNGSLRYKNFGVDSYWNGMCIL